MAIRHPVRASAILAFGLVTSVPVLAQDGAPVITVTATRTGEGEASSLSTISSEAISRLQPTSLIEALEDVAGIRAVSTGGVGGGSFLSIRGGEPNFTLVLVDGIRVNDPTGSKGGGFDFTLIDPALIGSVEVNRGASSAVHGSDALSGVVNIRLREPEIGRTGGSARMQIGSRGEIGGGGSFTNGWSNGGLLVGASAFDSNDMEDGSSLRRQQTMMRVNQQLGDFEAVLLGMYAHNEHQVFPEDSGGPELAVNQQLERGNSDLWTIGGSIRRSHESRVRPELMLSYSEQRNDLDTPAIFPGVLDAVPAMSSNNRLRRLEAIGDVAFDMGPLTATVGAAVLNERGQSTGFIDFGFPVPADFRIDRTTVSGFAEATVTPVEGLTANAAVRYDAVDDGPKEWTGRIGGAYRLFEGGPAIFAKLSEGFKLPSFFALANPLVGNPDLRPERSRNVEAGVEWNWDSDAQIRLAWFRNRFTDLIDFDPETFLSVNRARVVTEGAEAELRWRPVPTVALVGALTYLDMDSETPLRQRPRWQSTVGGDWQLAPALTVGATLRYNSSVYDSSIPTGLITVGDHFEANANLRYAISQSVNLDLALRNIGNSHDWQAVGFPQVGRSVRATLSAAF